MTASTTWPTEVIEHATRRDLLLIVGAGISASCVNDLGKSPPPWSSLILDVADRIAVGDRRSELESLVGQDRLLEAAELLKLDASNRSRQQDMFGAIKDAVDGPHGHSFLGSEWHEALVRAEPKVIVTTNYDKIVERATSSGYVVHDYLSSTVGADVRRRYPVLLKLHGSVDHVDGMVLSRRDYTDVRHRGSHAMDVLHALLLTRPALLLGYRLHDPDLQLVLENIFGAQRQTPPHYMLAGDDMPDYERRVLEYSYGVTVIPYTAGDHSDALAKFSELSELVASTPPPST